MGVQTLSWNTVLGFFNEGVLGCGFLAFSFGGTAPKTCPAILVPKTQLVISPGTVTVTTHRRTTKPPELSCFSGACFTVRGAFSGVCVCVCLLSGVFCCSFPGVLLTVLFGVIVFSVLGAFLCASDCAFQGACPVFFSCSVAVVCASGAFRGAGFAIVRCLVLCFSLCGSVFFCLLSGVLCLVLVFAVRSLLFFSSAFWCFCCAFGVLFFLFPALCCASDCVVQGAWFFMFNSR